jgi:Mn-containing catalase
MKAFAAALESLEKPAFSIGEIPPTPALVNKFFNDSTGAGDDGEADGRGPWNEGGDWEFVESPAFAELRFAGRNGASTRGTSSFPAADKLTEVLSENLQDLLHAEGQLVKALPKMAKAARSDDLRLAFEQHLVETQGQVDRLKEVFELLGKKATPKPCKGMAGLVEEGQEIISESREKDDISADLGLIAAAQKVEHYEIASYLSARTLASQAGNSQAALLLGQSLLEEQTADKLLARVATLLMESAEVDVKGSDSSRDTEMDENAAVRPQPRKRRGRSTAR